MNGRARAAHEPTEVTLPIRPNDFDSLGHVNNAIALEYLEAGRWHWFAHNRIRRSGEIGPVVARVEIDYRQQIIADAVVVRTVLLTDPEELAYRATFRQTIEMRRDGAVLTAVEARVDAAFIEFASRRLCSFQDFLEANALPAVI